MASKAQVSLICFLAGLFLSCHACSREPDKHALAVLSDFTFVSSGQAKFDDDGSVDTTYKISHGDNELPKPLSLERGVQYIFHHREPLDEESLALRTLPDKLAKKGFKIIKGPKSNSGLLYLVIGGPLFLIRFSDGNREFVIFNQVALDHSDTWTKHDYILVPIN